MSDNIYDKAASNPENWRELASRQMKGKSPDELIWETADRILTDSQRTVLWLRYAEELSNGEIARVLGRSQISVRVTLFRAREALAAHEQVDRSRRKRDTVPCDTTQAVGRAAGLKETLAGDLA